MPAQFRTAAGTFEDSGLYMEYDHKCLLRPGAGKDSHESQFKLADTMTNDDDVNDTMVSRCFELCLVLHVGKI